MNSCKLYSCIINSLKPKLGLLSISIIIVFIDQLTKYIARQFLSVYQIKPFIAFWNWTLVYNEGAAFSFLADQGGWQKPIFSIISIAVSIALIYYIMRKSYNVLMGIGLSLILGGAIGNLIDRIYAGKVTDFVDWYYNNHHWPAFNVADSAVCIGVAILLIENLLSAKKSK